MSNIINGLKRLYKIAKQNGPALFQGIKKGIKIGKEVIDISKNAYERINNVSPELGNILKPFIKNKNFERIESGLNIVNNGVDTIDKVGSIYKHTQGLKINGILPVNREKYKRMNELGIEHANQRHQEEQERIMADAIINNIH